VKTRHYTCRTVRNMLPLHAGGDLDPRHVAAVDEHLKGCLTCYRELREFVSMRGRLGVLAEAPLPRGILDGFAEEVMARIDIREPGPAAEAPRPASVHWYAWPRLAAAAAVLIAALAGWRLLEDEGVPLGSSQPVVGGVLTDGPRSIPHLSTAELRSDDSRRPRATSPTPGTVVPTRTPSSARGPFVFRPGPPGTGAITETTVRMIQLGADPTGEELLEDIDLLIQGETWGLEKAPDRTPRPRRP